MEGASTVLSALTEGVTAIAADAASAIGAIIPVALPIAGMIIVVTLGLKVFKKTTK